PILNFELAYSLSNLHHSFFTFFFYSHVHHRDLHSFPTLRSSDLAVILHASIRIHVSFDHQRVFRDRPSCEAKIALLQDRFGRLRSEEHTSELQSRGHLVCRLLLEKKKNNKTRKRTRRPQKLGARV